VTTRLIAPFVPFLAEALWQNLAVAGTQGRCTRSVHLCDYPAADPAVVDEILSRRMALVRSIVSSGRSARMSAKLKVRQPLAKVEVILSQMRDLAWLQEHSSLIAEELNVKLVEFPPEAEEYITLSVAPDLKRLGPRLGKRLPALRAALARADAGRILRELEARGRVTVSLPDGEVSLDADDLQARLQAKEGWTAAQGPEAVVVLSTGLTPELVAEGWVREIVHAVQSRRKEMNCRFTDRIELAVVADSHDLRDALLRHEGYVCSETLAVRLGFDPLPAAEAVEIEIAGRAARLYVRVVDG
jgi:isoleucyl-tRNA synthetase